MTTTPWKLRCVETGAEYPGDDRRYRSDSGAVLEVVHDFSHLAHLETPLRAFDARRASKDHLDRSGVWRFRELVLPLDPAHIVSRGEGNTTLYPSRHAADFAGLDRLLLKHEGENPTGSFKDRGMTTGISMARRLGASTVACASTGNTSASMASYAAIAGMRAVVFIPDGNIAQGKLAQALAYGARTIQIAGNFDDAMRIVEQLCDPTAHDPIYLLNSLNPFRLEGQKAIALEILQDLDWNVPDWIVCPGGNLGNSSAIHKALVELHALNLIDSIPRIAVIQAAGANPFFTAFTSDLDDLLPLASPQTIASAIRIGAPVSFRKSMRAVRATRGVVEQVTDKEIMDAKAVIDRAGIGCEPASAATLAGLRKLTAARTIKPGESVIAVLTGHLLKDPDATAAYHARTLTDIDPDFPNAPVRCEPTLDAVRRAIDAD